MDVRKGILTGMLRTTGSKRVSVIIQDKKGRYLIAERAGVAEEPVEFPSFSCKDAKLPEVEFNWGPGLGTDDKELKENISVTRVVGYTSTKPAKLEKIKTESNPAQLYKWVAIDNRYFLAALIPDNSLNYSNVGMVKQNKRMPPVLLFSAKVKQEENIQNFSLKFYVGPKSYSYLKTFDIGLDKTVDFGFFGFLGKIATSALFALYGITNNYGWAIIIMTITQKLTLIGNLCAKGFMCIILFKSFNY